MQPTLFPWSGYLGLMMNVDKFIYLDTVQFARRSWQQRNQIKTNNGAEWITIPVIAKGKRDQIIKDVVIDNTSNFNRGRYLLNMFFIVYPLGPTTIYSKLYL